MVIKCGLGRLHPAFRIYRALGADTRRNCTCCTAVLFSRFGPPAQPSFIDGPPLQLNGGSCLIGVFEKIVERLVINDFSCAIARPYQPPSS